ncbi:uncharacterized protein LOC114302437 [Camellia sinensis]|uniref:uncharacterized protein LOC114302437 n=1 Tax=Camellia sinensis TaxID=4442 RepID=UPI001035F262|nr:uncharacterized protein LOC114302437 [Camellia sinensis]
MKLEEMNKIIPMFIITLSLYSIMKNARSNDESETLEARMSRMEQTLAALTEAIMQQQRQQPLPPLPPPAQNEPDNNDTINLTQKFMKMKPPTFLGGIEPLKAETWLLEMEKLFEVFPCSETQKELKQGNMFVAKYEAKFTELAHFAPHMIDTDHKKARKFERGLDLDVFDQVSVLKLPTYVDVLDRAHMAEAILAAKKQTKAPTTEWRGKRSGLSFKKGRSFVMNKKQNTGSSSSSSQSSGCAPVCTQCGRRHRGVRHRVSGACFRYGKTGHMIRDCLIGSENANRPVASSGGFVSGSRTNVKTNTRREPLR